MDILSSVTVQLMLPFSSIVVQKFTIKLKDIASDFLFLEIKPEDYPGGMENSAMRTENSS